MKLTPDVLIVIVHRIVFGGDYGVVMVRCRFGKRA